MSHPALRPRRTVQKRAGSLFLRPSSCQWPGRLDRRLGPCPARRCADGRGPLALHTTLAREPEVRVLLPTLI